MRKIIIDSLRSFVMSFVALGAVLLVAGVVTAWTAPASSPPLGNASAPINVGASTQDKTGGDLNLDDLGADVITGNQICFGTDCRTSWTGIGGLGNCRLYVRGRVDDHWGNWAAVRLDGVNRGPAESYFSSDDDWHECDGADDCGIQIKIDDC